MSRIDYATIKSEIATFIGEPDSGWNSQTAASVESCIRTGIDKVIHNGLHQWTWMRPRWTALTADGQRRYSLPSDFVEFIGHELYFDGVNYRNSPISELPATRLMYLYSQNVTTGTPVAFAIEPLAHDGVTTQDQQLVLHPTPDAEYQLIGIYQIGVRSLSNARPYPPGGDAHGELFLASCLAAAEAKFMDGGSDKRLLFQEMLQSHIAIDLRRQPRTLGPTGGRDARVNSRSDARRLFDLQSGPTTYNGGTGV